MIKKDPTKSIRKHANKLEVHQKTVRTESKEDLNLHQPPALIKLWGVLENKKNATSYPNIGMLKIAIENEWNKIPEEIISKAWKSFRSFVDSIIEKKNKKIGGHIE